MEYYDRAYKMIPFRYFPLYDKMNMLHESGDRLVLWYWRKNHSQKSKGKI